MSDILDYLAWRGDLSFEQDPLNEVDFGLLSWLTYYEFGRLSKIGAWQDGLTLKEIADIHEQYFGEFRELNNSNMYIPDVAGGYALKKASVTARFGDVRVTRFTEKDDETTHTQFGAMTFLADGKKILAFRGTDTSVNGWREDCDLSFSKTVPSQVLASDYLRETDTDSEIILAGHSKGGNLAVYAAMNADEAHDACISAIWNFDGPGFCYDTIDKAAAERVRPRIHTYVPVSSLVGMLLDHHETYQVVMSSSSGIFQHDVLYWQVKGRSFLYAEHRNLFSEVMDTTLRDWIGSMSLDERREMVDTIFTVIESSGVRKFTDFSENGLRKGYKALQSMRSLTPDRKRMAVRLFTELIKNGRDVLRGKLVGLPDETE